MPLIYPTIAHLSPARRRLVTLMQDLRYGQIRSLAVVDGEPCFDPAPQLIRAVRLAAGTPHRLLPDTYLKPHVTRLLAELDALGTGTIDTIKIQDGLPVYIQVALGDLPAA